MVIIAPNNKLKKFLLLAIIPLLVIFLVFLWVNRDRTPPTQALTLDHTATIQGKIVSRTGSKIKVINNLNQSDELELPSNILIIEYLSDSQIASPSADFSSLKTDKEAIIILEYRGGKYQVMSITYPYIPPLSTTPISNP